MRVKAKSAGTAPRPNDAVQRIATSQFRHTTPGRTLATRRVPEKQVQRDVVTTAKQFGCDVVSFSQPFGALQTRGIADLRIYHRERKRSAWFEVKAAGGKQSTGQCEFQGLVESVGERYVLGGVRELLELLREWGFRLGC